MTNSHFKIVIVDDEESILPILEEKVSSLGHDAICFTSVEESFFYIKKNYRQISMVISDYKMSPTDGFQYKNKLNALGKHVKEIPFIIVTGYFDKEMMQKGLSSGINAFLEKPIKDEDLKERIETLTKAREELLSDELEMIRGFLEESTPILEEIENLILGLESDPHDVDILNTYFRLLHTIKGTAACVGLSNLASFAHKYEDFISEIRNNNHAIGREVISALLSGFDTLKEISDQIENTYADDLVDIDDKLKIFTDFSFSEQNNTPINAEKDKATEALPLNPVEKKDKNNEKMSVSLDLLNDFMELSGELTVIRNSIVKTAKNLEIKYKGDEYIELLNELLGGMYKITSSMQTKIYELRKVPLQTVFRPFKRLVRDISGNLGKKVEFETAGDEILIDTSVSKILSGTLIHLLRNSMDHGIESAQERTKLEKEAHGKLLLRGSEKDQDIVIDIIDDGKGIDPEIIKTLAIERGLYNEKELQLMSSQEIFSIIFESGFSTAEKVTDLSGRGVGMDMVRSTIESAGGRIQVESEVGKGTKMSLIIPIPKSVLIINSLLVKVSDQTFVVPMDNVVEVLRIPKENYNEKILKVEDGHVFSHNEKLYSAVFMKDVLELEAKGNNDEILTGIIVRSKKAQYALFVDEIEDFEEVVIKGLDEKDNRQNLFKGASLLGNGAIALIFNLDTIAEQVQISYRPGKKKAKKISNDIDLQISSNVDSYMLFDLGAPGHYCIELDHVDRLERVEVKKIEKSGDTYLLRYRGAILPLVYVAEKLGLSQMSHSEFLKQREAIDVIVTNIQGELIGLVIERMIDIGATHSKLDTSVNDREEISGTIYLNDKTFTVINVIKIIERYSSSQRIDHAA